MSDRPSRVDTFEERRRALEAEAKALDLEQCRVEGHRPMVPNAMFCTRCQGSIPAEHWKRIDSPSMYSYEPDLPLDLS